MFAHSECFKFRLYMVQNMFTSGLRHLFVICAKFLLREVYMTQFMGYGAECACVLTEQ